MPFALLTEDPVDVYDLPILQTTVSLANKIATKNSRSVNLGSASPATRALYGWFDFTEEGVEKEYDAGAPSDAFNGTLVSRTYPSKTLKVAADQRAFREVEIENKFLQVAQSGFIVSIGSIPAKSDIQTQTETALIAAALLDGETLPANYKIRDFDGVLQPVTPAQFATYAKEMGKHIALARKNANDHIDAIELLTNPQEIVDYDITTGWPANPVP